MPEDLGERTEAPSARRREEARDRGQVAKSADLSACIDLAGAFVLLLVAGSLITAALAAVLRNTLDQRAFGAGATWPQVRAAVQWTLAHAGVVLVPALAVMFAVSFVGQAAQVGLHLTSAPLVPRLDRLSPVSGLKRIFSRRSLIKAVVNTVKLGLSAWVVFLVVRSEWEDIAGLAVLELRPGLMLLAQILMRVCLWLLAILLVLGVADYAYQRWQHTQDLRMTRQEVKDEQRRMEGDLEVKGRRLRMARQIALQRIRQAVPKADVIVTNPSHFAVALRYDAGTMSAPRVVAKGADYLAFRIREIAAAANVPIVERPPLARALYFGVPVGRQIAPEFYEAVAEILAYVYRLNGKAA